jgi:RimJ/RimL family protein N-acetyltransferase
MLEEEVKTRLRKNFRIIFILVVMIIIIVGGSFFFDKDSYYFELITLVSTIIGLFFIYLEFRRSRDIEEADFIFRMNTDFNNDANIQEVFTGFNRLTKPQIYEYASIQDKEARFKKLYVDEELIQKSVVFFTFFETILILIDKGVITINMIDDLFAGRFFQLVHDPVLQEYKLVSRKKYYTAIYRLHKMWVDYRRDKHKNIIDAKFALDFNYDLKDSNYELRRSIGDDLEDIISLESKLYLNEKVSSIFSPIEKTALYDIFKDKTSLILTIRDKDKDCVAAVGVLTSTDFCNERFYDYIKKDNDIADSDILYIKSIAVAEAYWGNGFQNVIVEKFKTYAQDLNKKYIVLVVHEENLISKNNFAKLGFIESGIIELETKFTRLTMYCKVN